MAIRPSQLGTVSGNARIESDYLLHPALDDSSRKFDFGAYSEKPNDSKAAPF